MINVSALKKVYRIGENEVFALRGVDLTVSDGEFLAVVGSSGSGKSTLMNILGCLDRPTSGEYLLNGEDVLKMKKNRLSEIRNRKIGFIFQNFNLLEQMSAEENVELPLMYAGIPRSERKKIAEEALERVGLSHRLRHRPSELSGGQKQRVAIARAITRRPSVILADEPTGNLDRVSTEGVLQILSELHEGGATVVLITHDMNIADRADRTVRISDGEIITT